MNQNKNESATNQPTNAPKPTVEEVFGMMRKMMGSVPTAIEQAVKVDEGLLYEHLRSRGYAMPPQGALDEETRTLIYLAAALAASSGACIQAMANENHRNRPHRPVRAGDESHRRGRAGLRGAGENLRR
jgi:alkylhydroperoxidase/carboxymuconolactone decarboxylase family protein YurZ